MTSVNEQEEQYESQLHCCAGNKTTAAHQCILCAMTWTCRDCDYNNDGQGMQQAYFFRAKQGQDDANTDRVYLSVNFNRLSSEQQMRCTCFGLCMVSWVVAVAAMALLLPGLSCKDSERPDTSCTPRSVMLTLSSRILTVLSARTESDRGDITWGK